MTRHTRSLAATLVLVVLAIAPLALAKKATPKPKKGATPSASASAPAPKEAAPEPPPPAASAEPESAPSASASAAPAKPPTESATEATKPADDATEDPKHKYYYAGLRYRHTIIPSFLLHLFVNEGQTLHSNTIGAELDMRKEGQSTIPWIAYSEYGTPDVLFFQKGQPDTANNYSVVNSSLKAIYLGLDELWSTPITPQLDFEYGFGVGLGFLFGDLKNNWAYQKNPSAPGANDGGPFVASNGNSYAQCQTADTNFGCNTGDHKDATIRKVGGYTESSWFGGGSVPSVFPHISFPQVGLRYRPIKEVEARLGLGFSITGFWIGLSGDYDVEPHDQPAEPAAHKASRRERWRNAL